MKQPFSNFYKNLAYQKGAMFGLDARIALAIVAAISVVAGASMVQIAKDRRIDNILFEHEKISSAVVAMQEDLQTNIHQSLSTNNDENAYMALVDGTLLAATAQNRWLGPYLPQYNSNNHKDYGQITLAQAQSSITSPCNTQALRRNRECFYFYKVSNVPLTTINKLNSELDGDSESTPPNEGTVQWDTITANDAHLHLRAGLVAP